eukprot:jgi/Chlat1/2878/Chrsp195S03015
MVQLLSLLPIGRFVLKGNWRHRQRNHSTALLQWLVLPSWLRLAAAYQGTLFFADYAVGCVWAMLKDTSGQLDCNNIVTVVDGISSGSSICACITWQRPLYSKPHSGQTYCIAYGNEPLLYAVVQSDTELDVKPLAVAFTSAGSPPIVRYEWDFEGDGVVDSTKTSVTYTYTVAGNADLPSVVITSPKNGDSFIVNQVFDCQGQVGPVRAVASWRVIQFHCSTTQVNLYPVQVDLTSQNVPPGLTIAAAGSGRRGVSSEVTAVIAIPNAEVTYIAQYHRVLVPPSTPPQSPPPPQAPAGPAPLPAPTAPPTANLVASSTFLLTDITDGPSVPDVSRYGHDGVLIGNSHTIKSGTGGYRFDGSTSYICFKNQPLQPLAWNGSITSMAQVAAGAGSTLLGVQGNPNSKDYIYVFGSDAEAAQPVHTVTALASTTLTHTLTLLVSMLECPLSTSYGGFKRGTKELLRLVEPCRVCDGTAWKLYRNGVLAATFVDPSLPTLTYDGWWNLGTNYTVGL